MLYQLSYAREACILAADVAPPRRRRSPRRGEAACILDTRSERISGCPGALAARSCRTTGGARTAIDTAKLFDDAERHRVKRPPTAVAVRRRRHRLRAHQGEPGAPSHLSR